MLTLNTLPSVKRPRERLINEPQLALSLEDLIAVLIRTGSRDYDVLETSRDIASRLLTGRHSIADLASIKGVGMAKAAVIVAALQLAPVLQQRTNYLVLSDPEKIYAACADLLQEPKEHVVAFYLTARNTQIARETISIGTLGASLVHPREVFRPALMHNASHVVLAHNHPSGDPEPSQADRDVTLMLARAGKQLGIELVDHVVCGHSAFMSLRSCFPELFS